MCSAQIDDRYQKKSIRQLGKNDTMSQLLSLLQLLLFASSYEVDGMMTTRNTGVSPLINGTSRANIVCQKDAELFGLWGQYSALISTKQQSLQNITEQRYRHLPIVNTMVNRTLHVHTVHSVHALSIYHWVITSQGKLAPSCTLAYVASKV